MLGVVAALIACGSPTAAGGMHFAFQGPGAVTADTPFDRAKGYGFEPPGAAAEAAANCIRPASPDPILQSDQAARFAVLMPEGDYRVTLRFRAAPKSAVMAEARRFVLLPGTPVQKTQRTLNFTVDVRSAALPAPPPNAPGGLVVRLNPRECGSYSWDDKLTLAFTRDDAQRLSSLDIVPVDMPRLFLLGDSTVTDQPHAPYAGWGQMLPLFFESTIAVANHAESGETLKSFLAELRLDKVLSQAKPGDWALIQFAHNDEKEQWPQTHAPTASTFPLYLKVYIAELRRKGVEPVLVTPMQRLKFDGSGRIVETHGDYPAAIRAVAASEGVPVIDLSAASKALFETMGSDKARDAFAGHGADPTHQSGYGAFELARIIVDAMRQQHIALSHYLKPGIPAFDPARPDAVFQTNEQ